ncbi:chloride channel protein [Mycolicibacterium hodleri]|uniref:Chloride ion channel protein n=1 Tax=Mycolicibacterium hodleri TaxID=49897 RepID=A0A502DPT7_9MYCO|nr:chloride channel protein [Mycolicibacterium hodleri]TPG26156.1 chloride ion channel protein [Mycolicibacterium hodleri]
MKRLRPQLIFAAAILVTGVLSGLIGAFITLLVRAVQHLTYGYTQGPLLLGVIASSPERRLLGPTLGCAAAGLGWWLLRRKVTVPGLNHAIRADRPFAPMPMSIDALLQVLAVGSGASLGREQAPRMLAAVGTELLIRSGSLPPEQRRIVLAGAAGAGLAAVYNVPAAGALFTVGIVLRSWRPTAVLVAVATSSLATVTAWPVSHGAPTFDWPPTDLTGQAVWTALAVMPIAALVGAGFNHLVSRSRPPAPPKSWALVPAIGLAGLATGLASLWLPQLPGNGKSIVLESLSGAAPLAVAALAAVLKPTLTALFIRSGAAGGMITPALSTGTATGAFIALAIHQFGGQASVPTTALIGGAAVLGVTQRAPLFAAMFTAELTHPPLDVCGLLAIAALGAHFMGWIHRRLTKS